MVECPGCHAIIKPSSLEYHERMHKNQGQEKKKAKFFEDIPVDGIRIKRKAAEL